MERERDISQDGAVELIRQREPFDRRETSGTTSSDSHSGEPSSPKSRPYAVSEHTHVLHDDQQPTNVQREQKHRLDHFAPRRKTYLPKVKWITSPPRAAPGSHSEWCQPESEASEWLSLFYDLVVVAVLTIFSSTHELTSPGNIPTFLSYYVILTWSWCSQTHYDVVYQTEDLYHRIAKGCQIALFVYMGAASGNWDLSVLRDPDSLKLSGMDYTDHDSSGDSFTTVVIAFCVARALLAIQYLVSARLGSKAGRARQHQIWHAGSLLFSMTLSIIAVSLTPWTDSLTNAKIGLLYGGILSEIVANIAIIYSTAHVQPPFERLSERYGAFTLIILGEGFISLIRAFNYAISGLSTQSTNTYGQVFLVIVVIFCLYNFLFGKQDRHRQTRGKRSLAWELVHWPLHFGLLLLLASMVNIVVTISYFHGINLVADEFERAIDALNEQKPLDAKDIKTAERFLNKLQLQPPYQEEYASWLAIVNQSNPTVDVNITAYQYVAQVLLATTSSYNIEISQHTYHQYLELSALNTTVDSNVTVQNQRVYHAAHLVEEIGNEPIVESLSGSLWLYPTAGGVLLLSALRSMLWYHYHGPAHWVIHGTRLALGIALSFLGFLAWGNKNLLVLITDDGGNGSEEASFLQVNPMYTITTAGWPIAIVAIVYIVALLLPLAILGLWHKKNGGGVWEPAGAEHRVDEKSLQQRELEHQDVQP